MLDLLARDGRLDPARILSGLQHPSGSNAERIAYQLGRKPRERLSVKVDPVKIDAASTSLRIKVDHRPGVLHALLLRQGRLHGGDG